MALRHPLPEVVLQDFEAEKEPESTFPVYKKPVTVTFRPGGDIAKVAREIVGYRIIKLVASFGAGKSVHFPREIATAGKCRVLQVVPNRLLAVDLYDYLATTEYASKFALAIEPTDPIDGAEVVISYSGNVAARKLAAGPKGLPYGEDVIVFMDECQESDGFTYFVGKTAPSTLGVKAVVYSSATHEADREPMREPLGRAETRVFPPIKVADWDPMDEGQPWSVSGLDGNALLFIDSEEDAKRLVRLYNTAGVTAYRVYAKMPVTSFREIMKAMRSELSGIIVLVADYSFRNGFTMPIAVSIDPCIVKVCSVVSGCTTFTNRLAYALERKQGGARGARTVGSACVHYVADVPAENAICRLEGVECDAVALMCRYLGYAPFPEVRAVASMSTGKVPRNFAKALAGGVPLSLLPALDMKDLVTEAGTAREVEEIVASYGTPEPSPVGDRFLMGTKAADVAQPGEESDTTLDFLLQLERMTGVDGGIKAGLMYMCTGLPAMTVSSRLYGLDWQRALAELTRDPALTAALSIADRQELIAMFLAEYNSYVVRIQGIRTMLSNRAGLETLATQLPSVVKVWSSRVAGELREAELKSGALALQLGRLRPQMLHYVPVDMDMNVVEKIATKYTQLLLEAVESMRKEVDSKAYNEFIGGKIDYGGSLEVPGDKVDVQGLKGRLKTTIYVKPSRVGGRSCKDITIEPSNALVWTADDFADTLANYLQSMGLDPLAVRSLKLLHTDVSPEEVLSILKHHGVQTRRLSGVNMVRKERGKDRKLIRGKEVVVGD